MRDARLMALKRKKYKHLLTSNKNIDAQVSTIEKRLGKKQTYEK